MRNHAPVAQIDYPAMFRVRGALRARWAATARRFPRCRLGSRHAVGRRVKITQRQQLARRIVVHGLVSTRERRIREIERRFVGVHGSTGRTAGGVSEGARGLPLLAGRHGAAG